tara:strand:- start:369 stop:836 length:468 start_codon:yes stop_codon:yes gene_type:complete
MEQIFSNISITSKDQGFTDITSDINKLIKENNFESGILILNILHTSCSLTVNENADPNVLKDLKRYIESIVPYNSYSELNFKNKKIYYEHFQEGEDDMPAHIKTALTNTSLSLSVQNGALLLGTWQSIYLWEHRFGYKKRILNIHIVGEKRKKSL